MTFRRVLPGIALAVIAAVLTTQIPSEGLKAQETKADKAKAKQKAKEAAKKAEKTEEPAKPTPPPAEIKAAKGTPANPKQIAQFIDREINGQLATAKITPSKLTTDVEFIRRVSLDLTGVVPTPEKVQAFLDSKDADKRAKLIDELLADSKFGRHMSDLWIWQMFPLDSDNRFVNREPLLKWMQERFNANQAWNQTAHELINASGELEKNGAVAYYMANRGVDKITDSISKLFLGVQIQCAQCHNHPFADWKQTEYWGVAQFFYKVDTQVARNAKQAEGITPGVSENTRPNRRNNPLPESAKTVPAKFLGGETPKLDNSKPYRPIFADWATSEKNPFFAKSMVNRTWSQLFTRGLVNPIDDLREDNEATHPELLEGLTKEFLKSGFDLKHLIRCICLSDAYQRSCIPTSENKADHRLYSHQEVKVLTGEQLFDSINTVLGGNLEDRNIMGKGQRGGLQSARDRFAFFYMGSENAKATDYEAGIPQALRLMNNPRLNNAPNVLAALLRAGNDPNKVIDRLYLLVLSRNPTDAERRKLAGYVSKESDPRTAYGDILWALLNSSEFALNR